jgi:rhodanese-related sulfurtransferase
MTDMTPIEQLHPSELASADGIRRVDVREPHEYTGPLGHLPGAELVPLATLPLQCQSWDREAPVLLICRSGGRSGQAAAFLRAQGFSRPINLAGGMLAVEQLGLPVEGRGA